MKKSKKLKIITSSSVVATAAMITPMVATSCTANSSPILKDANAIDISTLNWFQETSFSTNNKTEIENIVISQNDGLFVEYKGLRESVTVTATYTAPSDIGITITATPGSFTGNVTWTATYTATPTPTPEVKTSVTYAKLAELKYSEELEVGKMYQITDYTTVVNSIQSPATLSAEHQFDIVVTATSKSTFSDIAHAINHTPAEGETDYFANSDLNAWELRYSFENDNTKYAWADDTFGKGVIYYMKDEFGNEAGYDFKNILFSFGEPNYYTFSAYDDDGNLIDASLDKKENVHNNVIKPYYDFTASRYVLNRIYFKGSTVYNNTFGNDCQDIVFEANKDEESEEYNYSNAINNTFGSMCKHNKFGYNCQNNTFGSICTNNTIGNLFQNNLFKNNCSYNTFENDKNTTCHINNTFASGITGLTVNRVLFAYNHITSNIDSITVSRALTNSILTNGVVFEPTIQYEMDDIDWNLNQTFSVGGEAQGILMAHNGFANIPNNQITWSCDGSDTELGASIIDPTPETPDEPYKVQIKPTEGDKEFDLKITATINGTTEITRTFTIDVLGINLTDWSTVINKGRTSTTTVEVEGKTVTNVSVSTDPTKTAVEFGTPSVTQPDQISITPEGSGLNLPFTITVTCNDTETGENLDLTCTFHFDIHNYQINTEDILNTLTLNGDLQYYEDSEGTPVTMTSPTAKVICKDTAVLEQERTATQYKVTFKDKSEGEKLGLNVLPTGNEFTVTPTATGELPLNVKVTDLYNDEIVLVDEDINIPVHHYVVDNNITIEDVEDPGVEVLPTDLVTNKKYKTSAIKITDAITTPATVVSEDKIANWNVNAAGLLITDVKTVTETNAQGELETHIEFNTNPLASGNEPIEIGATLITGTEISPITIDCTVTQGVITYGITGIQYFEDEEGNRTAYDPTKFPKLNQNTTYVTNWFNLTANGVPLSVEDIANVSIILNRNALDVRMTIPRNPGTNEYRLKFTPVKEREETAFSSQYQWSYMYGDSVVYQSGVLRIYYYKQS